MAREVDATVGVYSKGATGVLGELQGGGDDLGNTDTAQETEQG